MADGDDLWGCAGLGAIVLFGGWWFYTNYEIKAKNPEVPEAPLVYRPAGMINIGTLQDGSIWWLDADNVTGPREARQVWILADHTKNSTVEARETKTLYRINCETTAYRTLSIVEYDKDGRVIRDWGEKDFAPEGDYPPPGSYVATVVKEGCHKGFEGKPPPINISNTPPIPTPRQPT